MTMVIRRSLAAAAFLLSAGGLFAQASSVITPPPPRLEKGYLVTGPVSGILAISPPPPTAGSAAEARDLEASRSGLALHGSARWKLATADADVFGPGATASFSCAAGIAIGPATTPQTERLLRRTLADLALSGAAIKQAYRRP